MIKKLSESLEKIGWSIKGPYNNAFIFDQHGEMRPFRVTEDKIELSGENGLSLIFGIESFKVYEHTHNGKVDCVGIMAKRNKEVFLQFYNHD